MVFELFSKRREKAKKGGLLDVYQYDTIPGTLRVQIQQILNDSIGPQYRNDPYGLSIPHHNPETWELIHKILCREFGVHRLCGKGGNNLNNADVLNFIGQTDVDGFIDSLEICCRVIEKVIGEWPDYQRAQCGITQPPLEALDEINYRLKNAKFGFAYIDGQFIRLDSEFVHEEVVKPALRLLRTKGFEGPQSEFLQAHAHYRAGEYPQAITEAAKSFESALKAVCSAKGWAYEKGGRASDLLKLVRSKGLWPDYLDASFDQLLATLSSGLPKVRNESGAHGQGPVVRKVPNYVAAYALHLAAVKIVLITEAALA